jgi:hypothetical protein
MIQSVVSVAKIKLFYNSKTFNLEFSSIKLVLLTAYYLRDEMTKNEKGAECGMYGRGMRSAYTALMGKPEEKRPLGDVPANGRILN